jgi:SulP family sulfate permease
MRSGGDTRTAGLLLAAGTGVILLLGSSVVAYVPSVVVGALIFHLGLELMKESVVDTWGHLSKLDYLTVVLIIFGMAVFGFMEGIFLGIILACFFFVVTYSHSQKVIQSSISGIHYRSSVRRLYKQQKFLASVGSQIHILKLQGYLFFGTFRKLEKAIKGLLHDHSWKNNPIRFLILDLSFVSGVDFSAVEAFAKILRQLDKREVHMILCGVNTSTEVGIALRRAGIWKDIYGQGVYVFESLNSAMEWCENLLLEAMYRKQPPAAVSAIPPPPLAGE